MGLRFLMILSDQLLFFERHVVVLFRQLRYGHRGPSDSLVGNVFTC